MEESLLSLSLIGGIVMAGDHDQNFVSLFVRNQRRLYGYILTAVPDFNDADDIFQQTSMVLWEKAAEFRADGDFVRWACGIAFNIIRNYRVKQRRDRHCFSDEMLSRIAEVRVEKSAWLEDMLHALSGCVDQLLPADQNLLTACYDGRQTIRKFSQQTGRSENAVYQRLHRIRGKLLECIEDQARQRVIR